jgi:hypothetical protein
MKKLIIALTGCTFVLAVGARVSPALADTAASSQKAGAQAPSDTAQAAAKCPPKKGGCPGNRPNPKK